MGLFVEGWNVAYRNKKCGSILEDTGTEFIVIPNYWHGWCADPFVYEHEGNIYIFAEMFDYIKDYAGIGYCVLDKRTNKFSKWKVVIQEKFHMSYPHVFERDGEIYMLPETSENETLTLYRAEQFPDVWVKDSILSENIKVVDTTLYDPSSSKTLGLTYKMHENSKWELLLFELENEKTTFSDLGVISNDEGTARPGGSFFEHNGKNIRVSQDCKKDYGYALNFMELLGFSKENFSEKMIKYISPEDICINKKIRITGVHTYNATQNLEVIDIKSVDYNILYFLLRIYRKIKRTIKHG